MCHVWMIESHRSAVELSAQGSAPPPPALSKAGRLHPGGQSRARALESQAGLCHTSGTRSCEARRDGGLRIPKLGAGAGPGAVTH